VGILRLDQAVMAHDSGDYPQAHDLALAGLELLEPAGDRRGVALALAHLGGTATARRDLAGAHEYLRRSLQLHSELGEPQGIAFALNRFAVLACAAGQPERALRLSGAAAALIEQAGSVATTERRYLDEQMEPARRALGRMAQTVRAAGRQLTVSEAVAEALATDQVPVDRSSPDVDMLTPREIEVARLVARGCTNRRIAGELTVSEGTVATHVGHLLSKLALGSRAQIAVWATQHGLLDEPRRNNGGHDATLSR